MRARWSTSRSQNNQADQVKQELAAFAALVRESPGFARVSLESLDRAVGQTFRDRADRREDGREPHPAQLSVCDCRPAARRDADGNRASVQPAARMRARESRKRTVTSATELTAQERAELGAALAKLTGEKVQAQYTTDRGADRRRRGAHRLDDL